MIRRPAAAARRAGHPLRQGDQHTPFQLDPTTLLRKELGRTRPAVSQTIIPAPFGSLQAKSKKLSAIEMTPPSMTGLVQPGIRSRLRAIYPYSLGLGIRIALRDSAALCKQFWKCGSNEVAGRFFVVAVTDKVV